MIMPEMLTISQAAERLKNQYPETPIGERTLRTWQKENAFYSVTIGRKILISWASLVAFLSGEKKEGT